jgi:dolichol kinase
MLRDALIVLAALSTVLLSLLFSAIGVVRMKVWLVILGAVLLLPFSYYMNGYPSLRGFAILLPLFQMGSAAAVRENSRVWAWILLAPPFLAVLWIIGVAVVNAV